MLTSTQDALFNEIATAPLSTETRMSPRPPHEQTASAASPPPQKAHNQAAPQHRPGSDPSA